MEHHGSWSSGRSEKQVKWVSSFNVTVYDLVPYNKVYSDLLLYSVVWVSGRPAGMRLKYRLDVGQLGSWMALSSFVSVFT